MMTMMIIIIIIIIITTVTIKMPIISLYTLQCRSYGDIVMGNIVINYNYKSPSLLVTSAVLRRICTSIFNNNNNNNNNITSIRLNPWKPISEAH